MDKIIVKQLNNGQKSELKIPDTCEASGPWSVWECEPSKFDWHYDSLEKAFLYEGKVNVKTHEQEVELKRGDFVIFPKDLDCTWEVVEKVRKVYLFE